MCDAKVQAMVFSRSLHGRDRGLGRDLCRRRTRSCGLCALILLLAVVGPLRSAGAVERVAASDCIGVLFVGDSLTYVNNLPALYSAIAQSKGVCVAAAMVASGGESLKNHWESGDVVKALRMRRWDFVVLQDQTTFGEVYLVNGRAHVHDASNFFIYGRKLVERIRAAGAVPVLFLPWTPKEMDPRDAAFVRWAYESFGLKEQIKVVPVAYAWKGASKYASLPTLYLPDGTHPTAAGSYLAAALFVACLNETNPEGAVSSVLGNAVAFDSGAINRQSGVLLADIQPASALLLQKIAWNTRQIVVRRLERQPAPLWLPVLPTGGVLSSGRLNGEWVGQSTVYPYPATMKLTICEKPLAVKGVVDFGGRPDTIRFADRAPRLTLRTLSFVDLHGPNGGRVRYRAELDRMRLVGIGEIIVNSAPIYAVGEWFLTRRSPSARCAAA